MIPPSFVCLLWFSKSYLGYGTYSHLNVRVLFYFYLKCARRLLPLTLHPSQGSPSGPEQN